MDKDQKAGGGDTPLATPGSDAAVAAGCTCAVLDNAHGKGVPWTYLSPVGPQRLARFWITEGCPLHDAPDQPGAAAPAPAGPTAEGT